MAIFRFGKFMNDKTQEDIPPGYDNQSITEIQAIQLCSTNFESLNANVR